jgi:hypothetical protein
MSPGAGAYVIEAAAGPLAHGLVTHAPLGIDVIEPGKAAAILILSIEIDS